MRYNQGTGSLLLLMTVLVTASATYMGLRRQGLCLREPAIQRGGGMQTRTEEGTTGTPCLAILF